MQKQKYALFLVLFSVCINVLKALRLKLTMEKAEMCCLHIFSYVNYKISLLKSIIFYVLKHQKNNSQLEEVWGNLLQEQTNVVLLPETESRDQQEVRKR